MKKQKASLKQMFSWKAIDQGIRKSGYNYLIMTIACLIMMTGMCFNFIVMTENGGKMPVYLDFNYTDEDHFSYHNFSEVKHPYYSDIFPIFNGLYSLGDLFMIFAMAIMSVSCIYQTQKAIKVIIKYFKNEKRKK